MRLLDLIPKRALARGGTAALALLLSYKIGEASLVMAVGYGFAAYFGAWLWFGNDPDIVEIERLARLKRALDKAKDDVHQLTHANDLIPDVGLSASLQHLEDEGHTILKLLEEDENRFGNAWPFLDSFLPGVVRVSLKYASALAHHEEGSHGRYADFLARMEILFTQQRKAILGQDTFDLTQEIKVLDHIIAVEAPVLQPVP